MSAGEGGGERGRSHCTCPIICIVGVEGEESSCP